ncbi:MAG: hypothetical protein QXV17_07855 [Candidatus Micrarchaeaceae archaeon]
MVSLQPLRTVTLSRSWPLTAVYPYKADILDPTTPIFTFYFPGNRDTTVFVSGTNASVLNNQCGIQPLTTPALYSSTYNSAIIGGLEYDCSPCLSTAASLGYGPWAEIVNMSNGSLISSSSLPCPFFPVTSYSGPLVGLTYDLLDGFLIASVSYNVNELIFYFIPLTELGTLFSGKFPSIYFTVMVDIPDTHFSIFLSQPLLWNGNILVPANYGDYSQNIWMIPISTLFENMQPGGPRGSSITAGNIYQVYAPGNIKSGPASVMLYPTSSGPKSVIAMSGSSGSTTTVTIWDPSTRSIINQVQATWDPSTKSIIKQVAQFDTLSTVPPTPAGSPSSAFYKNTLLMTNGYNSLMLLDIVSGNVELTTSSVDASLIPTSRGYVLGTRSTLNNSSVTFDIYKVSYQNDFEFTNVSVSGSTITGTLYNATTGQAAQYQAVYLVQIISQYSNYIGDSVPVASAITDYNGQFTIEYNMTPGLYYGLVYMSS